MFKAARTVQSMQHWQVYYGVGPVYMFVPRDADRAEGEMSNVKARITAIVTVDATGTFLPVMYILKHSKSSELSPDQTTMTVVSNLNK